MLQINQTLIVPTYAEAFSMRYTRLIVTALNARWLQAAVAEFSGYASSVIGCDAEIGVELWLGPDQTPDNRPGASLLAFGFSTEGLGKAIVNRTGQCLMTCPTTAVFNGVPWGPQTAQDFPSFTLRTPGPDDKPAEKIPLGAQLRYFGDGFQKSKLIAGRRFWRIPVMDGEFIVEDAIGALKGIGGGNFLIQAADQKSGLAAAERAIDVLQELAGIVTPFPGGVVRSGSKVGSRYKALRASTSDGYCPTLVGRTTTELLDGVGAVYEIVIDGVDFAVIAKAMNRGIHAATGPGVIAISAGNYGGKLGKYHFKLEEILQR